jgi:hypothetical protein
MIKVVRCMRALTRLLALAVLLMAAATSAGTALAQSGTGETVMLPPQPKLVWEGILRRAPESPPPAGLGMRPPALPQAATVLQPMLAPPAAKPGTTIQRQNGTWIEGPGYDITYGADYDTCAKRCLGTTKCVMIEYYTPERKCNLYDAVRPQKAGGSSFVGIRK